MLVKTQPFLSSQGFFYARKKAFQHYIERPLFIKIVFNQIFFSCCINALNSFGASAVNSILTPC
jgi:hypothetical protein